MSGREIESGIIDEYGEVRFFGVYLMKQLFEDGADLPGVLQDLKYAVDGYLVAADIQPDAALFHAGLAHARKLYVGAQPFDLLGKVRRMQVARRLTRY